MIADRRALCGMQDSGQYFYGADVTVVEMLSNGVDMERFAYDITGEGAPHIPASYTLACGQAVDSGAKFVDYSGYLMSKASGR
jgi:hypothetical protein